MLLVAGAVAAFVLLAAGLTLLLWLFCCGRVRADVAAGLVVATLLCVVRAAGAALAPLFAAGCEAEDLLAAAAGVLLAVFTGDEAEPLETAVLFVVLLKGAWLLVFAFVRVVLGAAVLCLMVASPLLSIYISREMFLVEAAERAVVALFVPLLRAVPRLGLVADLFADLLLSLSGLYIETDLLSTLDAPGRADCLMLRTCTLRPNALSTSLRAGPP